MQRMQTNEQKLKQRFFFLRGLLSYIMYNVNRMYSILESVNTKKRDRYSVVDSRDDNVA